MKISYDQESFETLIALLNLRRHSPLRSVAKKSPDVERNSTKEVSVPKLRQKRTLAKLSRLMLKQEITKSVMI